MKFFLALAFLSMVYAIPRPETQSAPSNGLQQLQHNQGASRLGNNQAGIAKGPSNRQLLLERENSAESDYPEEDEDVSGGHLSLEDLFYALNTIREANKKKIQNKLNHNKDSGDIYVPPSRVPSLEDANKSTADAPQQNNNLSEMPNNNNNNSQPQNKTVSNNTKGNDMASDHKPKINITQIKKEIHDKIDTIIINVLRPWLGNNSAENAGVEENKSAPVPPQENNITVNDNGRNYIVIAPNSTELKPNESDEEGTTSAVVQEANNTELPPNNTTSIGIEANDAVDDLVKVNSTPNTGDTVIDNEISIIVPTESSQVRIVN